MAAPDTSVLTSVDDVFSSNYTLPQIRAIHKALHAQLEEKAARLRTQVGGSYRELLGTADTIVQMKADNDAVQAVLGRMGGNCGRGVVGSKVAGLAKFEGAGGEKRFDGGLGDGEVARMRLLEGCALVMSRVLKGKGGEMGRGDRLVLATKVWVLSRLLIKSFGEEIENMALRNSVEAAKKSVGGSKRKLLSCVKRLLEMSDEKGDRSDILKALAAYSLATNSGARDVLWCFLSVREHAMALAFDIEESERERSTKDVLTALNFYTRTLLDVQALVPYKVADALAALKKHPLLADTSLEQLEGLRLDVYERWCGDDVQVFTPYIRHDDLDGKQAREMLTSWAKKGGQVLLQGLAKTLERMNEFKAITDLRTKVLQVWIREGSRAKGFDPSEMLDKLRHTIMVRLLDVLEAKVNKLHLVGSEVSAALESWKEDVTDNQPDLWDESAYDMDMSNGAAGFLQEVVARMFGRNDAVSKAVNCYNSWRHVIDDVGEVVGHLRKQRWENDYDEIEDEETIEAREQMLSRDDPAALHECLDTTLEKAFKTFDERLVVLWNAHRESPNSGRVAMYFVRVIRDVRSALPSLESIKAFGLPIVPSLHEKIANEVAVTPLDEYVTKAVGRKTVAGRSLWEGKPELPSQPTPGTVRFLRDLSDAMSHAGMDLWSATAVDVLKGVVREQLSEAWREALAARLAEAGSESDAGEITNEEEEDTEKGDDKKVKEVEEHKRRDLFIQWLYDISYLRCCFSSSAESTEDEFMKLEEVVFEKSGIENAAQRQRITKSSQDYWKRTSLLFGLLA